MWPIIKKELKAYFDHPTAYILIVIFLVVNSFFYFRTAYLANSADLRPMFDFLPWILFFFVTAVTMKLFAEEKQSHTLELVMAQPISLWRIMLGKFLSSLFFISITLGLTLTIPLLLTMGGAFDWGQIIAQYLAAVFLISALAALGLWASVLSKNQVVSFMVALLISFFFYVAGMDLVTLELGSFLKKIFGGLSLFTHYNNLARGVIDLRDVVYFLAFIFVFLASAYLFLERNRVNRHKREYRQLQVGVVLLIIIAVVVNLLGNYIPGRLDLTKGQIFTLSPATKKMVSELDDLVTIKVFSSENLPTQINLLKRDVDDLMRDLEKSAHGNIKVSYITLKENDENLGEAQNLGIAPVQFNILKGEQFTLQKGYFGLSIIYTDQHETLPFIDNTANLEYKVVSLIRKLTAKNLKIVAFLTGHEEKNINTELTIFNNELQKQYQTKEINLSEEGSSLAGVDTLIIAGPKTEIANTERQKIKSFLDQGGKAMLLIDAINVMPQNLQAAVNSQSFSDFLSNYGVKVNNDLVYDVEANESVTFGGGIINFILPYPLWPRVAAVGQNTIASEVQSIFLPWSSSLEIIDAQNKEVMEIFKTSIHSGSQQENFNLRPDQNWSLGANNGRQYLMAVALNWVKSENENTNNSLPNTSSRLIVVGNSNFLIDGVVQNQNGSANMVFGLNSVDWLTQDDSLISIRSKNRQPASLVLEAKTKSLIRYSNMIGLPVLVILAGIVRLVWRRRQSKKIYSNI